MTRRGEVRAWIEAHVHYSGDDCLTFPYYRNADGYGEVTFRGERQGAHRLMARLAHGEPPADTHHAAHSCGRGAQGCVNPRHLKWATPQENQADQVAHGATTAGERHPRAYLTERAVLAIRELAHVTKPKVLAELFGTNTNRVYDILLRRTWRHI